MFVCWSDMFHDTVCLCVSPDLDGNRGTKKETLYPERPTGPDVGHFETLHFIRHFSLYCQITELTTRRFHDMFHDMFVHYGPDLDRQRAPTNQTTQNKALTLPDQKVSKPDDMLPMTLF
jgi:hypothetical protein